MEVLSAEEMRSRILGANDLPREEVPTPEWESIGLPTVTIQGLTAEDRDAWELEMLNARRAGAAPGKKIEKRNVRASLVARCLVDAQGVRVFTDKQIAELGGKAATVLDRLFWKARTLSGFDGADDEELVEGFAGAQADDSSSE